jgi:hypothetical protein
VSFQSGIFDEKNRENEHFWFEHFFFRGTRQNLLHVACKGGKLLEREK